MKVDRVLTTTRRLATRLLVSLAFFIGYSSAASSATLEQLENSRAGALAWLIAHQQDDGRWEGAGGVDVPATGQAVDALRASGVRTFADARGLAWLANVEDASVESLSRKALVLDAAGISSDASAAKLLKWRNASNSWGAYDQFATSFPDTALAIAAIRTSDRFASEQTRLASTVACAVLAGQGVGDPTIAGGWSFAMSSGALSTGGRSSHVSPTAHNLLEISAFVSLGYLQIYCPTTGATYSLSSALTAGVDWLLSQRRNPNGSFGGDGQGNPLETAFAYLAIQRVRPSEAALASAHDYLLAQQNGDGSWQGDAFVTATVLKTFGESALADADADGIPDSVELALGTNPNAHDSRPYAGRNGRGQAGANAPLLFTATINQPFSGAISAGAAPFSGGIVIGSLPDGLVLNVANGAVSGTPTSSGYYNFVFRYVDANSVAHSVLAQIFVQLAPDTTPPIVTAPPDVTVETMTQPSYVQLGKAYAVDDVDGPLIPSPSPSGPLAIGTHIITWQATDRAGNVGTATQQVIVVLDTTPNLPSAGLLLDLDAQTAAAQYANGAAVTVWQDISGQGMHATASGASAPTLVSEGVGGQPALRFDGVDDYVSLPAGFNDFTAGMSLYVVMRPTVLQPGFKLVALGNGGGQHNVVLGRAGSTAGLQYFTNNGASETGYFNTSDGLVANEVALFSVVQEPGAANAQSFAQVSKNGVALFGQNVYVPPVTTRAVNYIGKSYWSDGLFQGDIAEVILYSRKLTVQEEAQVRTYTQAKYGVGSIPTTPPDAPTSVTAVAGNQLALLNWAAVGGATGYRVYRGTNANGPYTLIGSRTQPGYVDNRLNNGVTYYYAVRAFSGNLESVNSAQVFATPAASGSPSNSTLPAAGLLLDLDAQVAALQHSNGAAVAVWHDASSNGTSAFASGSSAPTLVTDGLNGQPALRFDGVDDFLSLPAGFSDFTAGMSLYVVMRPTVLQTGFKLLVLGNGGGQHNVVLGRAGSTMGLQYFTNNGGGATSSFTTEDGIALTEPAVLSVIQNAGANNTQTFAEVGKNGGALYGQNVYVPPVTARAVNYIGKSYWNDGLFQGDVAEVILYNRKLTVQEQTVVRSYVEQKYGIGSGAAPQPTISALNPNSIAVGANGVVLRVLGSNFSAASVVRWNGGQRTTSFVSEGELQAQITAGDLAAAGSKTVTVLTPGAPVSAPATFIVEPNALLEQFSSVTLESGWSMWDGYAIQNPSDTTNHAQFELTGSHLEISFPGGSEHNQWLLRQAQVMRPYEGSGVYEIKVDSAITGTQQFGLTFQSAAGTFMQFMIYASDQIYAYVERFSNVAGQQHRTTVVGQPLGLPIPTNGPFYVRVQVDDHTNPMNRMWHFDWSADGENWNSVSTGTLEGSSPADNVGVIQEVGLFAGNQPPGFDGFTARFDYFRFTPRASALPTPGSLIARGGDQRVDLRWDAVAGAVSYAVYRRTSGEPVLLTTTTDTSITDVNVSNGTAYRYSVSAAVNGMEGPRSYEVVATPHVLVGTETLPVNGLQLLLSASELSYSMADGEPVTQWASAAGPLTGGLSSSARRPTFVADAIGGQPALRFDGVDDYLSLPAGFSNFTAGMSLYVVMRPTVLQPGFKIFALGNGGGQHNIVLGRAGSTPAFQYFTNNSAGVTSWFNTDDALAVGQGMMVSVVQEAGAGDAQGFAEIGLDGEALFGQNVYVPPVTTRVANYIGKSYWSDGLFQGDIAEVILYNRKLTAQEQTAVRNYVEQKYGITMP